MSYLSGIIFKTLKIIRFKKRIDFTNPKRPVKERVPYFPRNKYKTIDFKVSGHLVITIMPLKIKTLQHVIYFHGGAYSFPAFKGHFQLIKQLIDRAKCTVSYVDYPLAPEYSAVDTINMALETYTQLLSANPDHHFVMMGDSAGGGLALSLSMLIRDKGLKSVQKIILFSPWLDIKLSNERIPLYEGRDFVLDAESLRKIGEIYMGNIHSSHFLVSPKYGDLNGLGDIAVFFGSEEIFKPDCIEFCCSHNKDSARVRAYEYKNMQHDWVIFPIPETYKALDDAADFMKKDSL